MIIKVSDVMRYVRNHFVRNMLEGEFAQLSGTLTPAEHFKAGMWISVVGPDAPRGVYQLDENAGIPGLEDTVFTGKIYRLEPPADFIRLCGDISCWAAANPDPGVEGEKLGAYSVSRKGITWQEAFAPALHPYRKMFGAVFE